MCGEQTQGGAGFVWGAGGRGGAGGGAAERLALGDCGVCGVDGVGLPCCSVFIDLRGSVCQFQNNFCPVTTLPFFFNCLKKNDTTGVTCFKPEVFISFYLP